MSIRKSIPLIDSYAKFVEFNKKLHTNKHSCINIEAVNYKQNRIRIHFDGSISSYDLDAFILDFVNKQTNYIAFNMDLLEDYDFTKLYAVTHPEEFKANLYEYANNLVLMGEDSFKLWDYTIEIIPSGLAVVDYVNNKESLVIPNGITEIAPCLFEEFGNLISIKLPSTLKKIGKFAFCNTGLQEVVISDSVEIIEKCAFKNCEHLKKVKLSKNLKSLAEGVFAYTGIEEIQLPNNLITIESETFKNCSNLRKVVFPKNLKRIYDKAFHYTSLESIRLPNSVDFIGDRVFYGCDLLKSVKLPNKLEIIRDAAFAKTAIEEIHIPNTVTFLGDSVFWNCDSLKQANIPTNLKSMGRGVFLNSPWYENLSKEDRDRLIARKTSGYSSMLIN